MLVLTKSFTKSGKAEAENTILLGGRPSTSFFKNLIKYIWLPKEKVQYIIYIISKNPFEI